jgi:DNA polymerase-4
VLDRLSADLCAALAGEGRRGRTVSIKVRLADFSTHTRARTLETATNELPTVAGVARELLRAFEPRRPVRLLGVRVAGLDEPRREAAPQLDLPAAAPAAQANGAAGDLVSTPRP